MNDVFLVFWVALLIAFGLGAIIEVAVLMDQSTEYASEHAIQIKAQLVNVSFKTTTNGNAYTLLTFAFNNTTMQVALDGYQTSYAGHIGEYYILYIYNGQLIEIERVDDGGEQDGNP